MSMTRQHFELIADVINTSRLYLSDAQRKELASDFAAQLRRTNPNFDHAKFIEACGARAYA